MSETKAKVVTMCGSSKFIDVMAVCAWIIERDEHAVTMGLHLLPNWYCKVPDHLAEHEGVADEMDALHFRKIELSDEIFVINVDDYIGESTTHEVEYARSLGKTIRWFTHDPIGIFVKEDFHIHANMPYDNRLAIIANMILGVHEDVCGVHHHRHKQMVNNRDLVESGS